MARSIELPKPKVTRAYAEALDSQAPRMNGVWEEMGPWHYDPEVAGSLRSKVPEHAFTRWSKRRPTTRWCGVALRRRGHEARIMGPVVLDDPSLPLTSVYNVAIILKMHPGSGWRWRWAALAHGKWRESWTLW